MVWPLILAGAGVGAAAGAIGMGALSKKENSITDSHNQQNVYHSPYETYAPQVQYAPVTQYSYQGAQYMINSPNSSQTPKQAVSAASEPNQTGKWDTSQTASPSSNTGSGAGSLLGDTDFTVIALILGAAVVGYAVLRK
jgi:hypothetical protein